MGVSPYLEFVAADSSTSAEDLDRFSIHRDSDIRWSVAKNPHTSAATLTHMATDENPTVQWAVGRNPNTPPAVKLWLQTAYGQMSLEEFLNAVDSGD